MDREVRGGRSFPASGKDMDNGHKHPAAEDVDATTWTFQCQDGRAAAYPYNIGMSLALISRPGQKVVRRDGISI